MHRRSRPARAFTLVELLMTIAVVALLAALALTATGSTRDKAKRAACLNHLRQIAMGVRMYADDSGDIAPRAAATNDPTFTLVAYKKLMKRYVGAGDAASVGDRLFVCPADVFYYDGVTGSPRLVPHGLHEQSVSDLSSYAFNGGNTVENSGLLGISGRALSSIRRPARTALVAEGSAFVPWSWHEPKKPLGHQNSVFNDAMNMVGFVDGHVAYVPIFWDDARPGLTLRYDPPASYQYQWSGD